MQSIGCNLSGTSRELKKINWINNSAIEFLRIILIDQFMGPYSVRFPELSRYMRLWIGKLSYNHIQNCI